MILITSDVCAPCKMVKMKIDELKLHNKVKVLSTSSDRGRAVVIQYGIKSVPTLITKNDTLLVGGPAIIKYLSEV